MKRLGFLVILIVIAAFVLPGCIKRPAEKQSDKAAPGAAANPQAAEKALVVAKVGTAVITRDDFENAFLGLPQELQDQAKDPAKREWMLDKLIEIELVTQDAEAQGLDKDPKIMQNLKKMRQRILFQESLQRQLGSPTQMSDDAMKQYYDAHQDKFQKGERYKVAGILIKDEKKAQEALKEAQKPKADFAALVKKYSESPSAKENGDLGWFQKEQLASAIKNNAALKVGDVGGPIKSEMGFHVLKIVEVAPPGVAPYEEVKNEIQKTAGQEEMEKKFNDLKAKLQQKYPVTKFIENLPK